MSFIDRIRRQQAIYWKVKGVNAQGRSTYESPIQISCRWVDRQEAKQDAQGNEFLSRAEVYVGIDLSQNDALMLGVLESGMTSVPPFGQGAHRVRLFEVVPDVKARNFLRKASL